jgi:2-haloacid dehalogenase
MNNNNLPIILFDVNETLLDMSALKKKINNLLGSSTGFRIWFGMLLKYSL